MRTYYAVCTVNFTDNSGGTPWRAYETYSFIIHANNKKEAKAWVKQLAEEELERDLGKMDELLIVIDTLYQTSENARVA